MLNRILFLLLFVAFYAVHGQQIRIPLTQRAEDGHYQKLMLVTPVFAFRNDSVENPMDVIAGAKDDKIRKAKVVAPVMAAPYRKGYAFIFNGSSKSEFAANYTLLLIQNPGWTAYPTLIWTDRNNNFDLTDDGNPDTMTMTQGVTLRLDNKPEGYNVFVEHFPHNEFPLFCQMNDKSILAIQGERQFMGTSNSFRERRLNVLSGKWTNGRDSFQIAIKDAGCNGIYNDPESDVLLVADPNSTFDNLQGVVIDKNSEAYLEWNSAALEVRGIDPDGKWIDVFRDTAAQLKYSLNVGSKIPRFRYCTATKPQKRKSVRRLKGNYTYVYVWRDAAPNYIRDSASLNALGRRVNEDINVLGLNYGASGRYVYRYNKLFGTQITQGFSSNKINKKLKIRKIPTGILLDPKQKIMAIGITPDEALVLINDKKNKEK